MYSCKKKKFLDCKTNLQDEYYDIKIELFLPRVFHIMYMFDLEQLLQNQNRLFLNIHQQQKEYFLVLNLDK